MPQAKRASRISKRGGSKIPAHKSPKPRLKKANISKNGSPPSVKTKQRKISMNVNKPALVIKEKSDEQPVSNGTARPKNPSANVLPTEGYVLEVDGKFKSEYKSSEAAMKAALELKKKYPPIQVKIFNAKERTRTTVELP
jgi:hypothetical protein